MPVVGTGFRPGHFVAIEGQKVRRGFALEIGLVGLPFAAIGSVRRAKARCCIVDFAEIIPVVKIVGVVGKGEEVDGVGFRRVVDGIGRRAGAVGVVAVGVELAPVVFHQGFADIELPGKFLALRPVFYDDFGFYAAVFKVGIGDVDGSATSKGHGLSFSAV